MQMKLDLFAVQTTDLLSAEMKTYYEKRLIDNAEPNLVHDQFADKYPIPTNGGKTIEFRKYSALPKALTPITEGVTPTGQKLTVSAVTANVYQYGDYVQLSDMLELTAIDRNMEQCTKLLGSSAGRTLDTITREELSGGTQVLYAPSVTETGTAAVEHRYDLDATCKLSADLVFQAAAQLKSMNAVPVDDCYVAIIHPYVAYDLMRSREWIDAHKYAAPENIYMGEIGKLGQVRFVESTEAKVWGPEELLEGVCRMNLRTALDGTGSKDIYPEYTITDAQAETLRARLNQGDVALYVGGEAARVIAVTAGAPGVAKLTLDVTIKNKPVGTLICGAGAGKDGSAVFSTLFLGSNAYGTTEIEGGGLEHIVKQLGYGDDPLNQRSSVGWKATKAAKRLVEEYMLRVESGSSFSEKACSN